MYAFSRRRWHLLWLLLLLLAALTLAVASSSSVHAQLLSTHTQTTAAITGMFKEFGLPTPGAEPDQIIKGPDGTFWFTEAVAGKIGRITTAGVITEPRSLGSSAFPGGIVSGPGQHVSVVLAGSNAIRQVATDGSTSDRSFSIPTANSSPGFIASSGDGSFAFTEESANQIGRLNTDGSIQEFPIPAPFSQPTGITNGGTGVVVFTELNSDKIGILTMS